MMKTVNTLTLGSPTLRIRDASREWWGIRCTDPVHELLLLIAGSVMPSDWGDMPYSARCQSQICLIRRERIGGSRPMV
jgi:hypothetical protein